MFTPPPSPMPSPSKAEESSAESPSTLSLSLTTPETESEYPFPRVHEPSSDPKSPCTAEAGPSRIPLDVKKRTGRRILMFVALLPAALIITASLRHFLSVPVPDDRPPLGLAKREPQTLSFPLSGTPTPTSSGPPAQSSAGLPTTTSAAVPTIPTDPTLPTPFPQPFDLSLSSNFSTQSCEAFFANFTQQEEFRQCRSFSFLLNASSAFLMAQRNLTEFDSILYGTCNTPRTADVCAETMSVYLMQLNSVCAKDITDQNQAVLQAQIGFQSYTAMRNAACLQNPSTNSYCYLEAVAATSPADIYFYALPLGTPLPNGTQPSCSSCVRSVLSQYAQWIDPSKGTSGAIPIGTTTGNSTTSTVKPTPLPVLTKTYPAAARLAVDQCGGTYASVSVAQASGARRRGVSWGVILLGVLLGRWAL